LARDQKSLATPATDKYILNINLLFEFCLQLKRFFLAFKNNFNQMWPDEDYMTNDAKEGAQ